MGDPGCVRETGTTVARAESGAGDEWDRAAKWFLSTLFVQLKSLFTGTSFYNCYLIYQERTRLRCNREKDGGERKGSRNSSSPPPSHPPPMIYAGLFLLYWIGNSWLLAEHKMSPKGSTSVIPSFSFVTISLQSCWFSSLLGCFFFPVRIGDVTTYDMQG